jgi:FKBP-type peptidyl-prolyl cis-trans isomerase
MKLTQITAIVSFAACPFTAGLFAQAPAAAPEPAPEAEQQQQQLSPDRILEVYGYIVGLQSGIQDFDLNEREFEQFLRGLKSAQAREEMPRNLEQLFPQLQAYLTQRQSEVVERRARENRERAEQYFTELAEREGIRRTEEGLFYRIQRQGTGDRPSPEDMVRIHYEGRLIDGTVFDSSRERGEPAEFPLGGVIPGMAKGLQLIQEGGRITLHIPPDLGYGDQSQPTIPPGSVLIFDVELIDVIESQPSGALEGFQPFP